MILIAGCGYIGEPLADALHASGEVVTALTHSNNSADALSGEKPYPIHACDIGSLESLIASQPAIASIGNTTQIVHCASSGRGGAEAYQRVYLSGCQNLIEAFPSTRLLFTSSTSVYPQTDGSWVDEQSLADPQRETGQLLRNAEDTVLQASGTVARLAGIYGPGRSVILKRFLEGHSTIDGETSDALGRFLNQAHRDDIVSAILHLLSTPRAAGEIYNISDDLPLAQRDCYTGLSRLFGLPFPPVAPPNMKRKRGWTHKRISNAKLRATGWQPVYPSYLTALERDLTLVPSIKAQLSGETQPKK